MARTSAKDTQSTGLAQVEMLGPPHGNRLTSVLLGLALAMALATFDLTAPGTALLYIFDDLHELAGLTWVISSYILTLPAAIPIATFLSRRIGYRRGLVAGMVIFMVGSLLAGAAPTMTWLILFRGLQGLGACCLIGLIFTLFRYLFTPAVCVRWQAVFAGLFALCSVEGPPVALWLLGFASWRWLFWINAPLMAVALLLLIRFLPADRHLRTWKPIA